MCARAPVPAAPRAQWRRRPGRQALWPRGAQAYVQCGLGGPCTAWAEEQWVHRRRASTHCWQTQRCPTRSVTCCFQTSLRCRWLACTDTSARNSAAVRKAKKGKSTKKMCKLEARLALPRLGMVVLLFDLGNRTIASACQSFLHSLLHRRRPSRRAQQTHRELRKFLRLFYHILTACTHPHTSYHILTPCHSLPVPYAANTSCPTLSFQPLPHRHFCRASKAGQA